MVPYSWSRWRYCTPIAVISGSPCGLVRVSVVVTVDSILKLGSSTSSMPSKTRPANCLQTSVLKQRGWKRAARVGLAASKQPVRKPFRVKPWSLGLPPFEKVEELLEYLEGPDHR